MLRSQIDRVRNSTLAQNAGWLFAGQGASFVLQTGSFIALARLLPATQYGLLAGVVALVTIVSQYGSMGAGPLFMRYVSPDHSRFRLYWGNAVLSAFLVGGVVVLGLVVAGPWLIKRESLPVLILVAIGECVFVQLTASASYVFQTFEKMKLSATLALLTSALRFVLVLLLLFTLHKATAWQWGLASMLISAVVAGAAVWRVTQTFGLPSFSLPLFFKRAGEGFIFSTSGSTTSVYNDIDKVVLSHYGMNAANGIYSMAYRVVNIGTMPILSLAGAAMPRFYQAGVAGPKAVLPMAQTLLKRTAILGVAAVAGLFLCAPLLPRLAGKSYAEAATALRWLCLIPLFRCFNLSAGDALSGAGDQKYRLLCQSIAAIGNLGMNLYLVPRYSWYGAAWASLITDAGLGTMHWIALIMLSRRPNQRGLKDDVVPEPNLVEG